MNIELKVVVDLTRQSTPALIDLIKKEAVSVEQLNGPAAPAAIRKTKVPHRFPRGTSYRCAEKHKPLTESQEAAYGDLVVAFGSQVFSRKEATETLQRLNTVKATSISPLLSQLADRGAIVPVKPI